jgi:hypothetical protein
MTCLLLVPLQLRLKLLSQLLRFRQVLAFFRIAMVGRSFRLALIFINPFWVFKVIVIVLGIILLHALAFQR